MKKIFLALVALFAFGYGTANAQSTIYGGLALPTGDFGDAAKMGFAVGFQGGFPIVESSSGHLDLAGDVAVLFNSGDDEVGIDGTFMNVPALVGLKYTAAINPDFSLYGMGLVGVNMFILPDEEGYVSGYKATVEYDPAFSLAFGFGAGVIISENINVGVRYLILGEPSVSGTVKVDGVGSADFSGSDLGVTLSAFLITAGYSF